MIKQVLAEYVPTRYKELGTGKFTVDSFSVNIFGYFLVLCFYGIIHWAIGSKSPINGYIAMQGVICLCFIVVNMIARFLFKKEKAMKYMAVVVYLTASWAPILVVGILTSISKKQLSHS